MKLKKLKGKSLNKNKITLTILFYFFLEILSCDFTSPTNKKLLEVQTLLNRQHYEKAIEKYQVILEEGPALELKDKIHYHLGEIYLIYQNNPKISQFYFNKVVTTSKNPGLIVKAQLNLADIDYSFLKDYHSALKKYQQLKEFVPPLANQDFFHYRIAMSCFSSGDYQKAQDELSLILLNQENKYFLEAFYNLGMCFFHQKKWSLAVETWQKYLTIETREDRIVETKFVMANAYETMEELKKAYGLYQSILLDYPQTKIVQNRLDAIYARRVARKR